MRFFFFVTPPNSLFMQELKLSVGKLVFCLVTRAVLVALVTEGLKLGSDSILQHLCRGVSIHGLFVGSQ